MKSFFQLKEKLLSESHFKVGQRVKHADGDEEGVITKVDPEEKGKYYTMRLDSGQTMKHSPDELVAVKGKKTTKEATSYEDDIDPDEKIVVKGVRGVNSKPFTKKFRNMKAADKWMDDNEGDVDIQQVMNEAIDWDDQSDTGGQEEVRMAMRQLAFIEYAAEEISEYLEMRGDMDEWFQNKLTIAHSKMRGLHSYIEGDKRVMGMDESKKVQQLPEKAVSKVQQQAAGAALAAKRGDADPSELKGASKAMYKTMSQKELEDFASTKHKGLPSKVEEAKGDYRIYHNTYSDAVQHALRQVTDQYGLEVDADDYFRKVASGPRKPSSGKTNIFSVDLVDAKTGKPSRKRLHMQIYNMDNKSYELNMYVQ